MFFYATSFKICFHRSLSSMFTRNETFCERKGLQGFRLYGTYRRPSSKKFFNYLFFERFSVEKDGFLLFPVGEEWFSRLVCPFGYFWRCKIDEILTMPFYPWFSVWCCFLVFFKISQVFAMQGFASVLLIGINNLQWYEKCFVSDW